MTRSLLLALTLAACAGPDDSGTTEDSGEVEVDARIAWSLEDSANSPLAAVASVELEARGSVRIELWSDAVGPLATAASASGTTHRLDVVGMRADTTYELRATVTYDDGTAGASEVLAYTTGSLPAMPAFSVEPGSAENAGITLAGPTASPMSGADSVGPYLFGVDRAGEVVWLYDPADLADSVMPNRSAEPQPDGTLMIPLQDGVRFITPGGDTVREVQTALHHDAETLPNGHLVVLDRETRSLAPEAWGETVDVLGDVLVEVDSDGNEVWRWSAFDHLDTERWPGALSLTPDPRSGAADWTHANSVSYDAERDALIVSLRHQSWVIAVERSTGEVLWKLGEGGDFALESGEWFKNQHAATVDGDEVLLYDNGNEKDDPTSRGVRYRIDEDAGTAEQVWSWSAGIATSNLGDADALGDAVLVCAGGQRNADEARIAEVDEAGDVRWELNVGDGLWVYRAARVEWLEAI